MKGKKFGIIFGIFSSVIALGMTTLMVLCFTGKTNIIKKTCTVTFRDEDYRILGKVEVKQGEDAHYPLPELPEKAKNDRNQFKFSTWLPIPNNVKHDMTCFAVYISTDDINDLSDWADKLQTDVDINADINIDGLANASIVTVKSNLPHKNYLRCNSFGDFSNFKGDFKKTFLSTPFRYTTFDPKKPSENPVNYTANIAKNYVGTERIELKYNDLVFSAADKLPIKINLPVPQYNVINDETNGITYGDSDIYSIESVQNNEYQTMTMNLSYSPLEMYKLKEGAKKLTIEEAQRRDQYTRYVNNTYTQVSLDHAGILDNFIMSNNINKTSSNVIIDAMNALQNFAHLTNDIVKTPDDYSGDFMQYFFEENPSGNDQQFTIAATLLLRQLGIPTRAVVGLAFDNMFPGQPTPLSFDSITTWVECYIDQVGWILVDPIASTPAPNEESDPDGGDRNPEPVQLAIRYSNIDKVYDSIPVTEEEIKKRFVLDGHMNKDHKFSVELIDFNEVSNVGIYEFDTKFHFTDRLGKDVSKFYKISKPKLKYFVKIRPKEITVSTDDIEVEQYYQLNDSNIHYNPELIFGHHAYIDTYKEYSLEGTYTNYVFINSIYDDFMNDVTSNYVIHYEYGEVYIY